MDTMELSRREYPSMLDGLAPAQAVSLLNSRIKNVSKVNNEIADWLQERRRIEETYASSLRRLAQIEPSDGSSDFGIFTTSWQKVISSATALAQSHYILAQNIESDIEKPLRNFSSTNREMQGMTNMQGNLQALARDYDAAQKKSDKLKARAAATKVASASSEMDNASSQWTNQAPFVFEALQALDESRCNHLRDLLTQLQTHEVDLAEKSRKAAENTLNSILDIETSAEIRSFAARNTPGTPAADVRRHSDRRQSRSQGSNSLPAAPLPSAVQDDHTSQRSASIQEEKKSRLGGLKRLGTVMRRKSTQPTSSTPRASTTPLPRVPSANLAQSPGPNGDQPVVAREATSPLTSQPGTDRAEPQLASGPPEDRISPVRDIQAISGAPNGSSHQADLAQLQGSILQSPAPSAPSPPMAIQDTTRDVGEYTAIQPTTDPITQAEQEAAAVSDASASQFKVDIRNAPMNEDTAVADSAMADMANTLRAQAIPPRRSGTNRGRRDGRNSVYNQSAVLSPGPADLQDLPIVGPAATTPSAPAAPFPGPSAAPIFTSISATPDTPSLSIPSAVVSQPEAAAAASPPPIIAQSPLNEDRISSDNQSILSSKSTLAARHPAMQGPGLNSSIMETLSIWMEKGVVSRTLLIGELALAYNPSNTAGVPGQGLIRLENFSSLEKVAPNPALISESGQNGEFSINLSSLMRTGVTPTTAFKYQAHVSNEDMTTQAPIVLIPTWRVEAKQTSVILAYSLNPLFTSPLTLSNVTLIIHLETTATGSGKAISCQSKPSGTFSKERNLIFFRLDELSLVPNGAAQKILARFATEGEAKPGRIEARWEYSGSSSTSNEIGSRLEISYLDAIEANSDPFADDDSVGAWRILTSARKVISGTYTAV